MRFDLRRWVDPLVGNFENVEEAQRSSQTGKEIENP